MQGLWDRSLSLRFFLSVLGAKRGGIEKENKKKNISFLNPHLRVMCHGDATNKQHKTLTPSKVSLNIYSLLTHTLAHKHTKHCVNERPTDRSTLCVELKENTRSKFFCLLGQKATVGSEWPRGQLQTVETLASARGLWATDCKKKKGGAWSPSRGCVRTELPLLITYGYILYTTYYRYWGEEEKERCAPRGISTQEEARSTKCRLV